MVRYSGEVEVGGQLFSRGQGRLSATSVRPGWVARYSVEVRVGGLGEVRVSG